MEALVVTLCRAMPARQVARESRKNGVCLEPESL